MKRDQGTKQAGYVRDHYWRNPEMHREKARARKTRILIDRARIEALQQLQRMVQT